MRYFLLLACSFLCIAGAKGQVSSINENFDVTCGSGSVIYPTGWIEYNNMAPTDSMDWKCTYDLGRWNSPGMRCLGYYSGAYHLDTAWLFTPALTMSSFPDSSFLRFDSKYEVGYTAGTHRYGLATYVMFSLDTSFSIPVMSNPDTDISLALTPLIGPGDSSGWVTHELSLTPYKTLPTIRIAFRYVSTNTDAGAWTIDNVNTSPFHLATGRPRDVPANLEISAYVGEGNIQFCYHAPESGSYWADLWDMNGRSKIQRHISLTQGEGRYTLEGASLLPGVYSLHIWNAQYISTCKIVVF